MGLLKFLNASELRALVKMEQGILASDTTTKPGALLTAGDYEDVEYTLLQRNAAGGVASPWNRVPIASYSLQIGLFLNSNRSQLAFNDVWTPDAVNNKYTGTFNLNTPEIAALYGGGSTADTICSLEIQIKNGAGLPTRVYVNPNVVLRKGLITAVAVNVAIGEVAASQSWVKANMMPRNFPTGMHFMMRDASTGQPYDCWFDQGQWQMQPLNLPWPAEPPP